MERYKVGEVISFWDIQESLTDSEIRVLLADLLFHLRLTVTAEDIDEDSKDIKNFEFKRK